MKPCGLCDRAIEQAPSLKGSNADKTKVMFVLHKPDSRISKSKGLFEEVTSYDLALGQSKTGEQLREILKYCGLTIEDIYLTNFFKCTLPEDQNPRVGEYRNCITQLEKQIKDFDAKKIVFFSGTIREKVPKVDRPYFITLHPSKIWSLRNEDKIKEKYEEVRSFLYS